MKRFGLYIWGICLGEKLPVWATLVGIMVGALVTALSTFWLVPKLNESLERQKIRSEFVIRNLDDLNSRTRGLVADIAELHSMALRTDAIDPLMIQKAISKIAEMQWKAIELAIIFEGRNGSSVIKDYQKSLDDVRTALVNLKSKNDLSVSQDAVQRFSASTLRVVRELAVLGGLRLNESLELPKP